MDELKQIVEREMRDYAGRGLNGYSYFMKSDSGHEMSVIASFVVHDKHYVDASLLVRIEAELVIIEEDKTNKPLVDALLQAGVPREQIVLTYAGETLNEASKP